MQWLIVLLISIITARLELILVPVISIGDVMPDIMLLYVIYFALFCPHDDIPIYCWLMGLIRDLMFEQRLGAFAIAYLVTALVIRYVRGLVFRRSVFSQAIITFIFAIGVYWFMSFFRSITSGGSVLFYGEKSIYIAFYSAILAPFFYYLLGKVPFVAGFIKLDEEYARK